MRRCAFVWLCNAQAMMNTTQMARDRTLAVGSGCNLFSKLACMPKTSRRSCRKTSEPRWARRQAKWVSPCCRPFSANVWLSPPCLQKKTCCCSLARVQTHELPAESGLTDLAAAMSAPGLVEPESGFQDPHIQSGDPAKSTFAQKAFGMCCRPSLSIVSPTFARASLIHHLLTILQASCRGQLASVVWKSQVGICMCQMRDKWCQVSFHHSIRAS